MTWLRHVADRSCRMQENGGFFMQSALTSNHRRQPSVVAIAATTPGTRRLLTKKV